MSEEIKPRSGWAIATCPDCGLVREVRKRTKCVPVANTRCRPCMIKKQKREFQYLPAREGWQGSNGARLY